VCYSLACQPHRLRGSITPFSLRLRRPRRPRRRKRLLRRHRPLRTRRPPSMPATSSSCASATRRTTHVPPQLATRCPCTSTSSQWGRARSCAPCRCRWRRACSARAARRRGSMTRTAFRSSATTGRCVFGPRRREGRVGTDLTQPHRRTAHTRAAPVSTLSQYIMFYCVRGSTLASYATAMPDNATTVKQITTVSYAGTPCCTRVTMPQRREDADPRPLHRARKDAHIHTKLPPRRLPSQEASRTPHPRRSAAATARRTVLACTLCHRLMACRSSGRA